MARYLSLVSEDGDILVSIQFTRSEDADTARLRLFSKLRAKTGMYIIEIDKSKPLKKRASKNARS